MSKPRIDTPQYNIQRTMKNSGCYSPKSSPKVQLYQWAGEEERIKKDGSQTIHGS